MDRLLHGRDSAVLVAEIKEKCPQAKIMILSAINSAHEKATLLNLGADDYLAKPFEVEELFARIGVLLRRSQSEFKLGNVLLNSEKRAMFVDEKEVALQNKEFILLRTLIRSPGKVYNKTELYEQAWEVSTETESNVIEATVNKLRRRLEEVGASVSIKSMRNKGYWIEE
jgi:two-component system, OmpR family, response regulator